MFNKKESQAQWYQDNRERLLEKQKQYRLNNRENHSEKTIQWQRNNPKRYKEGHRIYMNTRFKTDPKFRLNLKIGNVIRQCLGNNKAGRHWEILVGYTLNNLTEHLKKKIPKGYTWQDYLSGKLHLDHKIPISAFNFVKPEHTDFKRCWALDNLQLLPAKENLSKNDKLDKPFQPALLI